ncbi:BioY protein [Desulfotomaculum nigrificans CO-1-SRB]|uniref:Biotin transporter n=1 Tax=Desulfotomaculum nigrificans (strain DSM 14880 / VKM B-2319 / CO-1-SRB) TaxID=868595 RepID=F6B546_DESCC|nr:biotin transporter BioY [Desulfotomaculum nigrificans]AEF93065.1 BioY protein [Desulfotomaculum nigrificans CO-1-SRB]
MKLSTREIVLAGLMAAVMVVVTVITRIPFVHSVVPFSMQPLIALLAGILLGPRIGALSMIVYLALGLVGVQVFATEPFGGPGYILKPSFGFLLSYPLVAYITGKILGHQQSPKIGHYLLAAGVGVVIIYLIGLPYVYMILNFYLGKVTSVATVIKLFFLPFILWDLLKAVAVAALARAIHRRLPEFSPSVEK